MTKKSIGYVELEWVCPNCETRNPGPQNFCNGCGAAQPHDVDFEQALEEEILTNEEQIARAQAWPDIHCPYCGARNAGDAKFCGACGGDLSLAEARKSGQVVGAHRDEHLCTRIREIPQNHRRSFGRNRVISLLLHFPRHPTDLPLPVWMRSPDASVGEIK